MATTPHHILIADDEDLVALSLVMLLEDHGYRVTTAHDGLAALEADETDPADLLITDIRMPRMDGLTLLGSMKDRRPGIPAVVMTGYSEVIPAETPGSLIVLRKPFQLDSLVVAVQRLLPNRK